MSAITTERRKAPAALPPSSVGSIVRLISAMSALLIKEGK